MGEAEPLTAGGELAGVEVKPLTQVPDERGNLMHMLRSDSPMFQRFGEIYFSRIKLGAVKAWRRHHRMICHLSVPVGKVRIVLYDGRAQSDTQGNVQSVLIGYERYALVKIPPGIWYGFQGEAPGESLIANCATIPHDPAELDRLPADTTEIPYAWIKAGGA